MQGLAASGKGRPCPAASLFAATTEVDFFLKPVMMSLKKTNPDGQEAP